MISDCRKSDLQTTFVLYPNGFIRTKKLKKMKDKSAEECQQACVDHDDCVTIERNGKKGQCHLLAVTARDVPDKWKTNKQLWNFYQRKCA